MKAIHKPKDKQCDNCVFDKKDCPAIGKLHTMPTISQTKRQDGVVLVKCTEFIKVLK